ncbi:MAG TPA: PH domain-containing protein [Streptosporangiaceae bacterium]|nr:PH domain-containing protein [Streptosporangiaceae bacterium]
MTGAESGAGAEWLRLSPRSLVVRPLTDLVRLVPLLAGLLILHSDRGSDVIWGVLAAMAAVVTGLVHWSTTRYRITDERVYVRRGLLNKKVLSVARDRIRTVDVTANLLHRVLGVCRVSIGTGRNDWRPGQSLHLDGLARTDAESLRLVLLAAASPADQEIVRLRLAWLRFAPLTMTGLVVLGVLFGSVIQITNATDINLAKTGPVKHFIRDFAAYSIVHRIGVGVPFAMAGYVLIALIGYVAVYWNFRLTEYGAGTVRVTRGLLSLRATTISLSRLRGVEISEPLLLRAAGGAKCSAITTGLRVGEGAEHEGSVLLPPAPRQVAHLVAGELLGVPSGLVAGPLRRHGRAALRRRYSRALTAACLLIAGIGAATWARQGPAWVWESSFALVPLAVVVATDRYRNLGHLLSDGWLVTRAGSFARRRSIIGTDAIIGWRIRQTWFQRRSGLMTVTATTAAGQQHYSLRDVPVEVGLAVAAGATADLVRPFQLDVEARARTA